MLNLTIRFPDLWDERKEEFICRKPITIALEHSLVSVSKWEAKWHKPFLADDKKSAEETLDYIRCMTITQNVGDDVYDALTEENIRAVSDYIEDPMTATWFTERNRPQPSSTVVTSELIYYWMVAFNIPFECQKWHLNRLMTLVRICENKNAKQQKMSKQDILKQQHALNEARRAKYRTRG